ncbi:MAG: hypothetical protein K2X29_01300, partial [Candidatus Obscuribacterales bacterium]|nr:hypothetical protein [Candidatus Obscuribacterales bacterium]
MYKRFGVAVVTVMSLSSLLLGAGNASAVTATASSDASRLSKNVVPTNYELVIEPQSNQGTFSGSEKVKIHVLAKQQDIVLNSVGLNIKNAFILRKSAEFEQHRKHIVSKRVPVKIEMMPQSERVKFVCGEVLNPGSYELDFEFTGKFD